VSYWAETAEDDDETIGSNETPHSDCRCCPNGGGIVVDGEVDSDDVVGEERFVVEAETWEVVVVASTAVVRLVVSVASILVFGPVLDGCLWSAYFHRRLLIESFIWKVLSKK